MESVFNNGGVIGKRSVYTIDLSSGGDVDYQAGIHLYRADDGNVTEYFTFDSPYGTSVTKVGDYTQFVGTHVCMTTNPDGSILYAIRDGESIVRQYQLSQPFDIVNSSFTSLGQGNLQNNSGQRFQQPTFNSDGTKLFVNGGEGDNAISNALYEYNLTTAFDVTTMSFSKSVNPAGNFDGGMGCVSWNDDGTRLYIGSRGDGANLHQYDLSTPFDIGTINNSITTQSNNGDPLCLQLSREGEYLFILHHSPDMLSRYTLTTPFDVTTLSSEVIIFDNVNNSGLYISGQPQY